MRRLMLGALLLALASVMPTVASAQKAQPSHTNAWYSCQIPVKAGTPYWGHKTCQSHAMPKHRRDRITGWWIAREHAPSEIDSVRYPHLDVAPKPAFHETVQSSVQSVAPVSGSYQQDWLVTYYLATGSPMANGIYPSVGWAACGYDVSLGTRVVVAGLGSFTCGDRIGYDPYHHIDIFGIPLGSGVRTVTVYP